MIDSAVRKGVKLILTCLVGFVKWFVFWIGMHWCNISWTISVWLVPLLERPKLNMEV